LFFLPWQLIAAYVLDLAVGDPSWLPHPVRWIGAAVTWVENVFYEEAAAPALQRLGGIVLWMCVVGLVLSASMVTMGAFYHIHRYLGHAVAIWLAWSALASRSLYGESVRVAAALRAGDIEFARERLSMLVSRDTSELDEAGIFRALVETVSENVSDGIVAPLFYLALGGPLWGIVYKAVNTMDSMVGYMNDRYRWFGWFPARMDDLANLVPARLAGWLLIAAAACLGLDWRAAREIMRRDARKPKSPNAGFPEAAAAGALGVQLGGGSVYFGKWVEKPVLGDPERPLTLDTYRTMVKLMFVASFLALVMALGIMYGKMFVHRFFG
jgi:adenosylcobinamide-phosphate synthase